MIRARLRQPSINGVVRYYRGLWQTLRLVLAEDARTLCSGLSAQLMRVVPNAVVMFAIYESVIASGWFMMHDYWGIRIGHRRFEWISQHENQVKGQSQQLKIVKGYYLSTYARGRKKKRPIYICNALSTVLPTTSYKKYHYTPSSRYFLPLSLTAIPFQIHNSLIPLIFSSQVGF